MKRSKKTLSPTQMQVLRYGQLLRSITGSIGVLGGVRYNLEKSATARIAMPLETLGCAVKLLKDLELQIRNLHYSEFEE